MDAKISPVTQEEIRKLMADLKEFSPEAAKESRRALYQLAKKVAEDARSRAKKRTGAMARATRARVSSRGDAMVTNNDDAARINEFGGRHPMMGDRKGKWYEQKAHPFLFPAVIAHREEFYREAERTIDLVAAKAGFR